MANGTIYVRTYYLSNGSYVNYDTVSWSIAPGNYTVNGVYSVAKNTYGLSFPTSSFTATTGTGISGQSTVNPASDTSHVITITSGGASYCHFYYATWTPPFTQYVEVYDYSSGSYLDGGSYSASEGVSVSVSTAMSNAGASIPSGYEFYYATRGDGTTLDYLSSTFTQSSTYETLLVYVNAPVDVVTVYTYYKGVQQDAKQAEYSQGSTETLATIISDSGVTVPTGAFSYAVYNGTTYTSLSTSVTTTDCDLYVYYVEIRTVVPYIFYSNAWHEVSTVYLYTNGQWKEVNPSFYIGGWK